MILFADEGYRTLLPLTHVRPAFGLRCGRYTLRERVARILSYAPPELTHS
ncbi:MAG: putative sugar nucleotidyl transferase [Oscillochloridaceae bacterium umkhey_bin13]